MKKILSLIIVLLITVAICGCANSNVNKYNGIQNDSVKDDSQKVSSNEDIKQAKIGDVVTFGKFQQEIDDKSLKPIEWIVLDIKGEKKLLISRMVLDTIHYCDNEIGSTWKYSNVNKWFNEDFFNSAFTVDEKSMITTCSINNGESASLIKDYVFTLSGKEVEYYQGVQDLRICKATPYAAHFLKSDSKDSDDETNVYWWCRSENPLGSFMTPNISYICVNYETQEFGLRPVIWVDLKDDSDGIPFGDRFIEGAETFEELLECINKNQLGSDEYVYTAVPGLTTLFAYGEQNFEKELPNIYTKLCSEISELVRQNLHHSEYSLHIKDYKEMSVSQVDYVKKIEHNDFQGWFDDVTVIWTTSGYVKSNKSYDSESFEMLEDDVNDGDFDTTLGIVEKDGRYFWIYMGW